MASSRQPRTPARGKAFKKKLIGAALAIQDNLKATAAGRPSTYHPGFCHIVEQHMIVGGIGVDLATMLGTTLSVVQKWEKDHPEFAVSIKRGEELADKRVEQALHHRAIGYSHPDTHISVYEGDVLKTDITKHYPPSEAAAIFWLKNRRPKGWKPDALLQPLGAAPDDAAAILRAQLLAMESSTMGGKSK